MCAIVSELLEESVVLCFARLQELDRVLALVPLEPQLMLDFIVEQEPLIRGLFVCRLGFAQFEVCSDCADDARQDAERPRSHNNVLFDLGVPFTHELQAARECRHANHGQGKARGKFFVLVVGRSV